LAQIHGHGALADDTSEPNHKIGSNRPIKR